MKLSGLPLIYGQSRADPADLATIGHLIHADVLPALAPKRRESIPTYLDRLGMMANSAGLPLNLQPYRQKNRGRQHLPEEKPGRLVLTLETAAYEGTQYLSAHQSARELNRHHPRFFGSLMVHLSMFTSHLFPVFTVRDALYSAGNWRYHSTDDFGFGEFWKHHRKALETELHRKATKQELTAYLREIGLITPRELFWRIGMNEVLPALKAPLCLSMDELWTLPTSTWARRVVEQVQVLSDLQQQMFAEQTDAEHVAQLESGEGTIRPLYVLTGERNDGRWTEVAELASELEQIIEGGEGFQEPFTLLIEDEAGARHAARFLGLARQTLNLMFSVVSDLTDNDE